jgi:hypothetical protein
MSLELKTHFALDRLLRKCLPLDAADAKAARKEWQLPEAAQKSIMLRSVPDEVTRLISEDLINKTFDYDLEGVPGFYLDAGFDLYDELALLCGLEPTGPRYFRWKLNLRGHGLVRPYYNERGRICGLVVHRSTADEQPRLLSSAKLYRGAKASPYNPLHDHELIHAHRINAPRSGFPNFQSVRPSRAEGRAA